MTGNFEIDYAFVKGNTTEFGTAHIMLIIGNTNLKLVIQIYEEISMSDLELLLKDLQNVQLKRLNLFIPTDCEVYLQLNKTLNKIVFVETESLIIDRLVECEKSSISI